MVTIRFAGGAAAASVEDEPVAEQRPGAAGKELDQVPLDADGVAEFCEAEALGETAHVGVDDDAFVFVKGISEDNIGRLASRAGECGDGFEGGWHFATVSGQEGGAHGTDVFGFVAVKAGGADDGLEFLLRNLSVVGCGTAALEEVFGDDVDPLIGALGGEDGGDEEFERIRVIELAVGVGVDGREPLEKLPGHIECVGRVF